MIGNNLVNVLATSLATSAAITLFEENGVVLASLAMTIVLVIFAEVLPKTYAFGNANRFALRVAADGADNRHYPDAAVLGAAWHRAADHQAENTDDNDREEELRGMIELHGASTTDAEKREHKRHAVERA